MSGRLERQIKKKRPFDSTEQAVVLGLLRTNDQFQYRVGRLLREHSLTQPQYNILRILRGAGGPLPSLEIAERMITVVPAITSLLVRLEERGLLRRVQCEEDRRVWRASITAAGRRVLEKLDGPTLELYEELCRGLSKNEAARLVELLEKAREGLEGDG